MELFECAGRKSVEINGEVGIGGGGVQAGLRASLGHGTTDLGPEEGAPHVSCQGWLRASGWVYPLGYYWGQNRAAAVQKHRKPCLACALEKQALHVK